MATTTTNFGWDIPQSTDLVKDGATAIAALGQDIDTAFVDLKGGTTGQVLAKASGSDLDFSWVAQDDSNAIQNAIVDAKGDLIAATAADTPARLAVGTNGQVLTADSTAATGLAWATASGSSGPTFRAYRATTDQTFSINTATKIQFNAEDWDTDSCYDPSSNYRFTANKAGYYQFNISISYDTEGTVGRNELFFYKNGASNIRMVDGPAPQGYGQMNGSAIIYLNGTTDYVEVYVIFGAATYRAVNNGTTKTMFDGVWIRS